MLTGMLSAILQFGVTFINCVEVILFHVEGLLTF